MIQLRNPSVLQPALDTPGCQVVTAQPARATWMRRSGRRVPQDSTGPVMTHQSCSSATAANSVNSSRDTRVIAVSACSTKSRAPNKARPSLTGPLSADSVASRTARWLVGVAHSGFLAWRRSGGRRQRRPRLIRPSAASRAPSAVAFSPVRAIASMRLDGDSVVASCFELHIWWVENAVDSANAAQRISVPPGTWRSSGAWIDFVNM